MNWLTRHWELKLVALVLALALHTYTSGQVRIEQTLTVSIAEGSVNGLPADRVVTGVSPREFKVRLSVPSSRVQDFESEQLSPRLELTAEAVRRGSQTFPVSVRTLGLTGDVRILAIEPDNVRDIVVSLDRVAEADLPVETPMVEGLPPGLEAAIRLQTTLVRVRAPEEALAKLRDSRARMRFRPIELSGIDPAIDREREERLQLTPVDGPWRVMTAVTAAVVLRPLPAMRQVIGLPIAVLASRELLRSIDVDLQPARVTLTLHGPEALLRALRPDQDLTAYVRLPDGLDPRQSYELPVDLAGPSWLTAAAQSVRVTLTPLIPVRP